jgi:hypothetical protein
MWSASSSTVISMLGEVGVALAEVVLEPARAGDEQVDAGAQREICGFAPTPPKTVVVRSPSWPRRAGPPRR